MNTIIIVDTYAVFLGVIVGAFSCWVVMDRVRRFKK